jgi:hypothetical protein
MQMLWSVGARQGTILRLPRLMLVGYAGAALMWAGAAIYAVLAA